MKPLGQEIKRSLAAADGWSVLHCSNEALHELDGITTGTQHHPEVLKMRCTIHIRERNWKSAMEVAKQLCEVAPSPQNFLLYANLTRELEGPEKAFLVLVAEKKRFPRDYAIPYNMACCMAVLGDYKAAAEYLRESTERNRDPRFFLFALQDPDLRGLWAKVGRLSSTNKIEKK